MLGPLDFHAWNMSPSISRQELSDLCYFVIDELLPFFILPLDPVQNILRVCPAADTAYNEILFQCGLDQCINLASINAAKGSNLGTVCSFSGATRYFDAINRT